MACPYFLPTARCDADLWPHRRRLPLGDGWQGTCSALGYEGASPEPHEIAQLCNLGYARECVRRPQRPQWEAVRFAVCGDGGGERDGRIFVRFVCEADHLPIAHGTLEFRRATAQSGAGWVTRHDDVRVQAQADAFLACYLERRPHPLRRKD